MRVTALNVGASVEFSGIECSFSTWSSEGTPTPNPTITANQPKMMGTENR